jgi:hypothetical protein
MYKFKKRDFVYVTIIVLYYFFNVEVFDYTFQDCIIIDAPPVDMRYGDL